MPVQVKELWTNHFSDENKVLIDQKHSELQQAGKTDGTFNVTEDHSVTRVFIDQESADAYAAFIQSITPPPQLVEVTSI